MNNRFLPIHRTGWFYLILIFWVILYFSLSTGSFNYINQVNINQLEKITSSQQSSNKSNFLKDSDILTLHSSFDVDELPSVTTLLSLQPNSQITLLGKPSHSFINKLKTYLSNNPRDRKIVINSNSLLSASPLKAKSTTVVSDFLNWFRFTEKNYYSASSSPYFVFTPLLLNERQSFPLVWQHQDKNYLSLPGEILQQLSKDNALTFNQHWQLSLNNTPKNIGNEVLTLGFLGNVFSNGNAYKLLQPAYKNNNVESYNPHGSDNDGLRIPSVNKFIKGYSNKSATSLANHQYKVIIITDKIFDRDELVKPLLINLVNDSYLSQSFLTLLLYWALALIGLALVWLIQNLSFKQQLASITIYIAVLIMLQYFLYNQQEWLEVLPTLLGITGTWLLLLAYHKEVDLLSTAINHQTDKSQCSAHSIAAISKKKTTVKNKENYKSPQNFSPAATALLEKAPSLPPLVTKPKQASKPKNIPKPQNPTMPVEELEQTLVIIDTKKPNKVQVKQQLSAENFGRYQVEGILGKGAMGIVYQGVDPKINRHVAIKTLQLSDDVDSPEFGEAKERFFREAQTAGGLSHANIVTIYDVGEENNLGYIAMDLLTGAPLSVFTQVGQMLPVPLIYKLLIQITDALEYAHNQNVVHRDIKPANIIYDDDLLKVTITDFGIAYVSDHSKTRTGVIMGSPYYMSPEQILGLKVDGRSDIFSLGVTFYQLLSGQLPFEGESIATVAYQITKAKPIAVNQHNSKLPASALRITNKAMHKDIEKRYQSMAEFKLALVNALKRDFKITAS